MKRLSAATAQQALLILLSLVSVYPIWFTIQTALKSSRSYSLDPTGLPREPTLANFHELFTVMPFGHDTGTSVDDHVHIDVGFVTVVPREISEDRMEQPQESRPRFAFEERRRRERRAVVDEKAQ